MIQESNLHWRYFETATNLILPWYTLPCLEWLTKQDVSEWNVFEYGSGYSTIWWRASCNSVSSIEMSRMWAKATGAMCVSEKTSYIRATEYRANLDCIIIDGEWRDECVEYSASKVIEGGYMIIDNYGQDGFPSTEVIDKLLEGWEKQVFKQPNHTDWATAVFKKP